MCEKMNIEGVFGKKNIDKPLDDKFWDKFDKKIEELNYQPTLPERTHDALNVKEVLKWR